MSGTSRVALPARFPNPVSDTGYTEIPFGAQILERLVRMETKLDEVNKKVPDHESRIRGLEQKLWMIVGAAMAAGGTAGGLVSELLGRN